MAYLITGGTGFIGSYICRALVRSGEKVISRDYFPTRDIMGMIMTPEEEQQVI
ncbi:MAG: NAD(P)-dependent oxidoreductase [Deltaproteobacteria bacterium]|nr:NAD(P)-dependent oxidoreductase [Deltaproteobacteria bacterium]